MSKYLVSICLAVAGLAGYGVLAQSQGTRIDSDYSDTLKPFLTDAEGFSLYLFTEDTAGQSTCTGACAEAWPPLTATGQPQAGEGVATNLLGTLTRPDGTTQVTYSGHPLYRFKDDRKPGESNGEGVGDAWYLVSPYGLAANPTTLEQAAPAQQTSPMGDTPNASPAALQQAGETVYTSNCAVCHGATGEGGTGPTLAENTSLDDTELILRQVIRGGRIMPPFGDELSDEQISAVATFIRNTWGNEFGSVTAQDVSANR